MKYRSNQGFGSMELAVVVLLVGLIALLGYVGYAKYSQTLSDADTQTASLRKDAQESIASDVPTATTLESSEDFATILSDLDSLDSNESSTADTKELDQAIADF